jgi:hypothetical protein
MPTYILDVSRLTTARMSIEVKNDEELLEVIQTTLDENDVSDYEDDDHWTINRIQVEDKKGNRKEKLLEDFV